MQQQQQQFHRPLASFSTMRFYTPQPQPPQPQPPQPIISTITTPSPSSPPVEVGVASPLVVPPPLVEKQKLKIIIKKKHTTVPTYVTSPETPVEKQKLKITIIKRKSSFTEKTPNKIKIIIKKQPKKDEEQPQTFINDIAPPTSMIYNPCSDYIVPPPKCCRFFIDNRHCFLRSTDNACIDPITKKVFGFWNCEIGKKSELLPPPTDDVLHHDDHDSCDANLVQLDNNDHDDDDCDDDCNKKTALEMRKKSDANRARFTGQPLALLRQKIATKYGMQSFNSLGNCR